MTEGTKMSFVEAVGELSKASRFVRAFARIEEVLTLAAGAEEMVSKAEQRRSAIIAETDRLVVGKVDAEQKLAVANAMVNRELADLEAKRRAARQEFDEASKELAELTRAAKADHDETIAGLERQRNDIEGEKGRLEAELTGLQASLDELKRRVLGK